MPFQLDHAPHHLQRLRYVGFNVLRIPVVWEALEHGGPGIYDEEYIDRIVKFVEICNEHGFRVIINPHQDLWSRYAGGSGAPLWTVHACGLDPNFFADTHAAVRYAEWPMDSEEKDPKSIPGMMWTTNHNRLATNTVFAMFFGGRDFAPKCVIDGLNIQDYLQQHYFAVYARLAERLGDSAFGYDSMNEPEPGYIGWDDLSKNEADSAKIGDIPSPVQCMRLGMGIEQNADEFRLGQTGPHKTGTTTVSPKHPCWLEKEDPRWKWTRYASWPLNTCVWALHGVWDIPTGELQKPKYFDNLPETPNGDASKGKEVDTPSPFVLTYWQEFYHKWARTMQKHSPKAIIFMQPTLFTPPPETPKTGDQEPPIRAGYSPHFYDALTVMRRHWHERWNADIVGLMRGRYGSSTGKALGLRVGRGNVRKLISDELGQLAQDGKARGLPTIIGEMGIHFDLDDAKAYKDGDYSTQVLALDTQLNSCDDHLLSYTLWAYSAINDHEWGDYWNGEDVSIACAETGSFPNHPMLSGYRAAAAWCRPYVTSTTGGQIRSMSFDIKTSKFTVEIESHSSGHAILYVPWLHYRGSDEGEGLDVDVVYDGESSWPETQYLRWDFKNGRKLTLKRRSDALSPEDLGTIIKKR